MPSNQEKNSITFNFIMNVMLTLSSFIFPLISYPYVTRILSPGGIGKVAFATSLIAYFEIFAKLGVPVYGVRACAVVRDDKEKLSRVVHELLILNVLTTMIAYIAFIILLVLSPRLQEERGLYIIMSASMLLNTVGMEWVYKALERYAYITIRSVFFKALAVVLMIVFVNKESDYALYGALTIFAASASNILNFINVRKYIYLRPLGQYNIYKHLKTVIIFFAMACATTVYTNLDTVMLGLLKNDYYVGLYDTALKVRKIVLSVVTSLGAVILPRSSYYVEHSLWDDFYRVSSKALHFVYIVSLPLMVFFIIFAMPTVMVLSGKEFEGAAEPMRVIMPTVFLVGLSNIFGIQMLLPLGREKTVLRSEIYGAVVDFILNLFLIPSFAATGAAIGTLVAEFVVLIVQWADLKNEISRFREVIPVWKIVLSIFIALLLCLWTLLTGWRNIQIIVVSAIIFGTVYSIVLLLLKDSMMQYIYKKVKKVIFFRKS